MADLGLAKIFAGPSASVLVTKLGTSQYMAPELYQNQAYDGPPVDVFALGQILYMIRTACFCFAKSFRDKKYALLQENTNAYYLKYAHQFGVADSFLDLVQGMTKANP